MNESDLIIKAATLLAKDFMVDGNIRKTLLKFQSNQQQIVANEENDQTSTDDDIELFLMHNIIKKGKSIAKIRHNPTKRCNQLKPTQQSKIKTELRPMTSIQTVSHDFQTHNNEYFKLLENCDDLTFQNQFKFTKKTFEALQQIVCPLLDVVLQNKPLIGNRLSHTQMLLCSIWIITTREPIYKISERFNLTNDQLYQAFRCVCDAISSNKHIFIKWPNEADGIKIMEQFNDEYNSAQDNNKSDNNKELFPNVCGIIGCTNIQIPFNEDNNCANSGESSDEKFSIVKLQIICDSKGLFMDTHVEQTETISNVMVFNKSAIKRMFDRNLYAIPIDGHLIGDHTYPLKTFLMVPYKENRKSNEMSHYNICLMKKRKIFDKTINQLKERFSRLNFINMNLLSVELTQCIEMACVIHNFCIENFDEYCLQVDGDDTDDESSLSRAICRDFTIDQRAIDKRNRILDNFKMKYKN